jgi:hypothetical protein
MFEPDKFRPTPVYRRVLYLLMAVATAVVVILEMTSRWGLVRHVQQHPADVAACGKGQADGCVGSKTAVIALPQAPAPSASR